MMLIWNSHNVLLVHYFIQIIFADVEGNYQYETTDKGQSKEDLWHFVSNYSESFIAVIN